MSIADFLLMAITKATQGGYVAMCQNLSHTQRHVNDLKMTLLATSSYVGGGCCSVYFYIYFDARICRVLILCGHVWNARGIL